MNLYLSAGGKDQVPGDLIGRWISRSDLAPVPRTVEFSVQAKEGMAERMKVGASVWTGRELLEYEIVAAKKELFGGIVQDRDQVGAISVTALLKSVVQITYLRSRAVVRNRATLGEIYRSCGATAAIADDFQVDRFSCFRGQVPSFWITQALQEEGAALVFRDNRLSVKRLKDLVAQDPVQRIGQTDSTDSAESQFIERHSVPSFISTDDAGAFVKGDLDLTRGVRFLPRTSERALRNSTRVLVVRRVVDSDFAQQIIAGDVIEVNQERHVVITAAHQFVQNGGITETLSRFWVGGLIE